jgi:fatty acid CoA ligase FadD9
MASTTVSQFRTAKPIPACTSSRQLTGLDAIGYGELWVRVHTVAGASCRDTHYPVSPGEFVATVGFTCTDYAIVA